MRKIHSLTRRLFERFRKSPYHLLIAISFMFLGAVAFFTPFTPGSWLFLVGLALLGVGPLKRYIQHLK